jgi:hypothetical protein
VATARAAAMAAWLSVFNGNYIALYRMNAEL